jgi:hypothetical protein
MAEGRSLELRWVLANMVGSSLGFGVFAVLAHGLVSPHDEVHPTLAQVGAHTLGLLPAGAIIALAQQFALRHHSHLARWFTVGMSLSMTIAFLVGAYGLRPPFDFLFAYAAAGAALELALRATDRVSLREAVRRAAVTGLLFAAGAFVGMLALSLVARTFGLRLGEPGEDVPRHIITMVLGGLFIGAAIGLLSARLIAKRLRPAGPRLKPDS